MDKFPFGGERTSKLLRGPAALGWPLECHIHVPRGEKLAGTISLVDYILEIGPNNEQQAGFKSLANRNLLSVRAQLAAGL